MGGYNSVVEHIVTKTKALITPYQNNDEQSTRIHKFGEELPFQLVSQTWGSNDWREALRKMGQREFPSEYKINLSGIESTKKLLLEML
jgi:predicted glycosyltransferase